MDVLAELYRAGVDPDLIGRVAEAISEARARGTAEACGAPDDRTPRQRRNARYYQGHRDELSEKRLKTSDLRRSQTKSDDVKTIKTVSDAPSRARDSENNYLDSRISPHSETTSPRGPLKKSKPRSRIAEDQQPTDKDRDRAQTIGMDAATFRSEWTKFRAHHVAAGTLSANWHMSWVKWTENWISGRYQARAGPASPAQRRTNNALDYFAHLDDQAHDLQPSAASAPLADVTIDG